MITGRSVVTVSQNQVSCELADEAAILHLEDGIYYGLDPVGARIWSLLQQPMTVTAVLQTLLQEYDVEPEQCERDLLALLEELASKGLIEVRDEIGDAASP